MVRAVAAVTVVVTVMAGQAMAVVVAKITDGVAGW